MADVKNTQAIFAAMLESKASRKAPAARKIESKKPVMEATGASMFTGRLLKESVQEDDVVEDIIDNIVVVTDPDKTTDDLENRADDIQDAIEGSPEGEAAFSDEYVGDKVYACPICGESFFADEEYTEGDVCPICKAEPTDGFLLQGVVSAIESESEELEANEPEADDPELEITDDDLDLEGDVPEEEPNAEAEEEPSNESYKKRTVKEGIFGKKKKADNTDKKGMSLTGGPDPRKVKDDVLALLDKRYPELKKDHANLVKGLNIGDMNKAAKDGFDFSNIKTAYANYKDGSSTAVELSDGKNKAVINSTFKGVVKECDEPAVEVEIEVNLPETEMEDATIPGVELDEKSFNSCLNQFAEENYSDCIDCFEVDSVSYVPAEDSLKFECKATTTAGDEIPVTLKAREESCNKGKAVLSALECSNVFKVESKKPAFRFNVCRANGVIRCESMKYGFITTHSRAGKVKVEGFCRSKSRRKNSI